MNCALKLKVKKCCNLVIPNQPHLKTYLVVVVLWAKIILKKKQQKTKEKSEAQQFRISGFGVR